MSIRTTFGSKPGESPRHPTPEEAPPSSHAIGSRDEQLKTLAELRTMGVLTHEEFEDIEARLLSGQVARPQPDSADDEAIQAAVDRLEAGRPAGTVSQREYEEARLGAASQPAIDRLKAGRDAGTLSRREYADARSRLLDH